MTHNCTEVKSIVATILDRLSGVTPTDAGCKAICPAHEDKKPSLSVSEDASGKILVHCHAGCTVESVLSAIGLTLKDLFPESKLDCSRKAFKYQDAVHKPAASDDVSAFSFAMTFAGKQVKPSGVWPYHTSSGEVAFPLPGMKWIMEARRSGHGSTLPRGGWQKLTRRLDHCSTWLASATGHRSMLWKARSAPKFC